MANVSFHLKAPGADRPTAIYALLTIDRRNRVKVYSGQSIHPKLWIAADQRAQVRGHKQNGHLNDALDQRRGRLLACYAENLAAGILPTTASLKAAASPPRPPEPEKPMLTTGIYLSPFWQHFENWIEVARNRGQLRTAQANATAGRHLREFGQLTRRIIDFDTITLALGDAYTAYLLNNVALTDNTICKQIERLKRFLRWASERGYHTNTSYTRLQWKRQAPEILTLTLQELSAIEQVPLPAEGYLDNARALFLLACYTGLRYSDLVSIKPEHLRGNTIRLTMHKTREVVTVPLRAEAVPLVARYLSGGLRLISNQNLNDYLKELGQLAGIDETFELIRYRGGKRETTALPKWKRLSCHCGRRSFVTLALERGLRPELIMKITGHRDWKSFQRYVNITSDTVEREFARVYGLVDVQ